MFIVRETCYETVSKVRQLWKNLQAVGMTFFSTIESEHVHGKKSMM